MDANLRQGSPLSTHGYVQVSSTEGAPKVCVPDPALQRGGNLYPQIPALSQPLQILCFAHFPVRLGRGFLLRGGQSRGSNPFPTPPMVPDPPFGEEGPF